MSLAGAVMVAVTRNDDMFLMLPNFVVVLELEPYKLTKGNIQSAESKCRYILNIINNTLGTIVFSRRRVVLI